MKIPVRRQEEINLTKDTAVGEGSMRRISALPNTGDIVSNVGATLSDTGSMLEKAYSLAEKTKAQNILSSKLADIHARAGAETDLSPEKQKKYHEEIDSAVRESSSYISLQDNKDLFLSEADNDANLYKIKVSNDFLKKTIDQGKADLIVYDGALKNEFINASSPTERQNIILRRDQKLKEAVAAGYLTREEAAKKQVEDAQDWGKAVVQRDIQLNPQGALNELQRGTQGSYANLDEKDRTELITSAQNLIEKQQNNERRKIVIATNKNEDQLLTRNITQGDLTSDVITEQLKAGKISPTFAKNMISVIESPKTVNAKTDPLVYMDLVDRMSQPHDASEIRKLLLKKHAEGKLSNWDLRSLYSMKKVIGGVTVADEYAQEVQDKSVVEKPRDSMNFMKSAIELLKLGNPTATSMNMIQRFIERISGQNIQGKALLDTARALKQEQVIQDNPDIAGINPDGEERVDVINGTRAIVYPDGSYKELGEGSGEIDNGI